MRLSGLLVMCLAPATAAHAGPPYVTDDPEPVPYRHWELYLASQDAVTPDGVSGTAPHVELNYGAWPEVQLHVIAPLAYDLPTGARSAYGAGDVELGVKVRFVRESGRRPMVGTFPLVELPTAGAGLGEGRVRVFVPLWVQASSGPWTGYGGGGYLIDVGARGSVFLGAVLQRRLSRHATLGGELYDATNDFRFDVGLVVDATDHHHVLLSAGRSIVGDTRFQGYAAYQLTW